MSAPARHLIIVGAPKCGTTTLFGHLATHPAVAPSRVKEPGFFYPRAFDIQRPMYYEDGLAAYKALFVRQPGVADGGLRLEASANYLYAPGIAQRIALDLADVRILVVLRNPISRLISEYRYACMMQRVPYGMGFVEYLKLQLAQRRLAFASRPSHLRALENGRYSNFLPPFFEIFGRERVQVHWFEQLCADPQATVDRICHFAKLPPHTLAAATRRDNPARQVMYPRIHRVGLAMAEARMRRRALGQKPGLVQRAMHKLVAKPCLRMGSRPARPLIIRDTERASLARYYAAERAQLQSVLRVAPPW